MNFACFSALSAYSDQLGPIASLRLADHDCGMVRHRFSKQAFAMTTCDHCAGSGVAKGPLRIDCEACHGVGRIIAGTCPACDGSGEVIIEADVLCDECEGSGFQPAMDPRD